MARKLRHDPPVNSLGISRSEHWMIAVDNWGGVLESRKLPVGTDLYDELIREHLRYHSEGWEQERLLYLREFHVRRRDSTPRRVYITGLDPNRLRLQSDGHYDEYGFKFQAPSVGRR